MQVMGVQESERYRRVAWELTLQADHPVIQRRGHEVGTQLFTNLNGLKTHKRRELRNGRKELRIRHDVLLLPDAVAPKRRHRVYQTKTTINDSETRAVNNLTPESPRNASLQFTATAVTD